MRTFVVVMLAHMAVHYNWFDGHDSPWIPLFICALVAVGQDIKELRRRSQ